MLLDDQGVRERLPYKHITQRLLTNKGGGLAYAESVDEMLILWHSGGYSYNTLMKLCG
jgi:hypothetical protein